MTAENGMPRASLLEALLFWLMVALGTIVLLPAILLRPWVDYHEQLERRQAIEQTLAQVTAEHAEIDQEITHIQTDPAYVRRLAKQQLGEQVAVPDADVAIIPTPSPDDPPPRPIERWRQTEVTTPPRVSFEERFQKDNSLAVVFLEPRLRMTMLAMGGALVVAALVLLGPTGRTRAQRRAASASDDNASSAARTHG